MHYAGLLIPHTGLDLLSHEADLVVLGHSAASRRYLTTLLGPHAVETHFLHNTLHKIIPVPVYLEHQTRLRVRVVLRAHFEGSPPWITNP